MKRNLLNIFGLICMASQGFCAVDLASSEKKVLEDISVKGSKATVVVSEFTKYDKEQYRKMKKETIEFLQVLENAIIVATETFKKESQDGILTEEARAQKQGTLQAVTELFMGMVNRVNQEHEKMIAYKKQINSDIMNSWAKKHMINATCPVMFSGAVVWAPDLISLDDVLIYLQMQDSRKKAKQFKEVKEKQVAIFKLMSSRLNFYNLDISVEDGAQQLSSLFTETRKLVELLMDEFIGKDSESFQEDSMRAIS